MSLFKKIFVVLISAFGSVCISHAVSAATIQGELLADTGTYGSIALGESIVLDGCGSVYDYNRNSNITGTTVSLCNGVTDLTQNFTFSWGIATDIDHENIIGYLPESSITPTLTTGGISDIITAAGTYFLSLNITFSPIQSTFALPGGDIGSFSAYGQNRDPNSDTFFSTISFTVTPATVPEPAAALLLIPALFYMARRQRKLRKL